MRKTTTTLNIEKIRADFPSLSQKINGKPLVYLDSAATALKPQPVIDAIANYYSTINSNVHRGVHTLSQKSTDAFENARKYIAEFINAEHTEEIIFTKGTTEAINLVASTYGKSFLQNGDEVIISAMEHHANIVPWQTICNEKKAILKVIPIDEHGELDMVVLKKAITKKTKIIAITHISNVLGTINPVKEIVTLAHRFGIPVLLDGAQGIVHEKVDVRDMDCDFYCFSGHKLYAPMGIGVLYGKKHWLESLPPYQTGGEMIKTVSFKRTTFAELPFKFEAGTPNVAGAIGLEAAIAYLNDVGIEKIREYESDLHEYAEESFERLADVKIYGNAREKAGIISFLIDGVHPYDSGFMLDKFGIAVRTGYHCAEPLMDVCDISGTVRASLAFYNTKEDIDILAEAILKVKKMF